MLLYTNFNGEIIQENLVHISPGNQSFRYGDGCFETMKMIDGNLLLQNYHFERLHNSLDQLKLNIPTNLYN
jgi:branched-subunit amino acid aminotransferase/4-amino-4-deoxychorismate lyase